MLLRIYTTYDDVWLVIIRNDWTNKRCMQDPRMFLKEKEMNTCDIKLLSRTKLLFIEEHLLGWRICYRFLKLSLWKTPSAQFTPYGMPTKIVSVCTYSVDDGDSGICLQWNRLEITCMKSINCIDMLGHS